VNLKHILAVGALLFSCSVSARTPVGVEAYNSSPPIQHSSIHGEYVPNVEKVKADLRAAELGNASAQFKMALRVEAFIWSSIAAISGDDGAKNNRDLATSKLSPEELEAANIRATKLHEEIQQRKG
jgi:hypothetical protein